MKDVDGARVRVSNISRGALDRMIDVLIDLVRDYTEIKAVLQQLLDAKDEKQMNGESRRYLELKDDGWRRARKVLEK